MSEMMWSFELMVRQHWWWKNFFLLVAVSNSTEGSLDPLYPLCILSFLYVPEEFLTVEDYFLDSLYPFCIQSFKRGLSVFFVPIVCSKLRFFLYLFMGLTSGWSSPGVAGHGLNIPNSSFFVLVDENAFS